MINDNWSRFYTPKNVAKEILSLLPKEFVPAVAVDICAGSGNFLNVADEKWNNINLIAIDVDLKNLDISSERLKSLKCSALNVNALENLIKPYRESQKILLANPPFGKYLSDTENLSNIKGFLDLKSEAEKFKRIELLILIANISILNKDDYFAAVIPENFFSSFHLHTFKELFLSHFDNIIISKTFQSFYKSEVKTRYFIGKFRGDTKSYKNEIKEVKKIRLNNIQLYRGIDNSKLLCKESCTLGDEYKEALHFSNSEGIIRKKKFVKNNKNLDRLKVEENDLLILRVGRKSGSVFSFKESYKDKYISDYFYILKNFNLSTNQIINLEKKLKKNTIGLVTNYLTKDLIVSVLRSVVKVRA